MATTVGAEWSAGKAGVDLDPEAPRRKQPPRDGWRSRLRLLPLLPAAIRYDRGVQRGTPKAAGEVSAYLTAHVGHGFPALAALKSKRARRSVATMLRENLDPATSRIGIELKVLIGAVFATVVDDEVRAADMRALGGHVGVDEGSLQAATALARDEVASAPGSTTAGRSALMLALAASPSPARVDATTVVLCKDLSPEQVVEVVTWLAVLQMLHRLTCYTAA